MDRAIGIICGLSLAYGVVTDVVDRLTGTTAPKAVVVRT